MTNNKSLLEHQKQRLEHAIDKISTPIFSTKTSSGETGEVFSFKFAKLWVKAEIVVFINN